MRIVQYLYVHIYPVFPHDGGHPGPPPLRQELRAHKMKRGIWSLVSGHVGERGSCCGRRGGGGPRVSAHASTLSRTGDGALY